MEEASQKKLIENFRQKYEEMSSTGGLGLCPEDNIKVDVTDLNLRI